MLQHFHQTVILSSQLDRFWTVGRPLTANMPFLCALCIARAAASALEAKCQSSDELFEMSEKTEVLKEILAQIDVWEQHLEFLKVLEFCKTCLWMLRSVLLKCHVELNCFYEGPPPRMPAWEGNAVWSIQHPDRRRLWDETKSGLQFLVQHEEIFQGEPWVWLVDFLKTLDYYNLQ